MSLAFYDKIGIPLFQKCGTRTWTRPVIVKAAATVGIDIQHTVELQLGCMHIQDVTLSQWGRTQGNSGLGMGIACCFIDIDTILKIT